MCEIFCQTVQKKREEKRIEEEKAAKGQSWKFPVCYDDDDDEESSNFLNDNIVSELPSHSAVIPTEPIDSLSMGDEHLDTISATKSDKFIKSRVENLVPNPSESWGENECDVLAGFTTFSNVLFDDNYDFDSSDDQSLSDEIDSLFDEFAGELTLLKSFSSGINKTDCHPEKEINFAKRLLYDNSSPRPPEEIVSDISTADIESFSPPPIPNLDSDPHMEEIDLYFNPDDPMPPGIEEDDDDSERDVSILEELLDNYSLSLPTNESYHFDIPSPYQLSAAEAIQADCDVKATNIILQGLPPEVYALVSTHKVAKELWERIQMLMQRTSLTKQERECKLYDAFNKFAYQKGETLRNFYLRFSLLLNDMNMHNMKLEQF
nr:hypothetical protein [Tanacetum cinerariifolium]